MTPRERWLAVLDGRQPDRVPTDIWATDEVFARLRADLGCRDDAAVCERLHIDRPYHAGPPFGLRPRWKLPHHPDDPQADAWGVRYRRVNYGAGPAAGTYDETAHSPLAAADSVADIERFRWPRVEDFDFGELDAAFARGTGPQGADGRDDGVRIAPAGQGPGAVGACQRIVQAGEYEPFLLACQMRGLERAYRDLLRKPAVIEAILQHIFDFCHEQNRRIFSAGAGRIDLFYLAEDLGGQYGPLLSLPVYRRFLKPNQIRMAKLARRYGVRIFYHTDGAARAFLPELIDDVGIDVLNPIQWRCPGMERAALVRDFGGRVAFHGAMDNQRTLPFGSVGDVENEVRENLELFAGARWICAPCHRIQPNTPTANIVALYQTIHELGAA